MKNPKDHSKDSKDHDKDTSFEIAGADKAVAAALAGLNALEHGEQAPAGESSKKSDKPGSSGAAGTLDQVASLMKRKDETIKEAHDRLLRLSADFENYKKRSRKDQEEAGHRANEKFIQGLLPILDSFERTLQHAEGAKNITEMSAVMDGIRLIHRQTLAYLDQMGVKVIDPLEQAFDPKFHEAIMQQPSTTLPHHHVLQVVEKGYLFRERLLRAAKVVVAENPANPGHSGPDEIQRVKC